MVHGRHSEHLVAIVVATKRYPNTITMAADRIGLVSQPDAMYQFCCIDADTDTCSDLFVLRSLFVYVNGDIFGTAVMVYG